MLLIRELKQQFIYAHSLTFTLPCIENRFELDFIVKRHGPETSPLKVKVKIHIVLFIMFALAIN